MRFFERNNVGAAATKLDDQKCSFVLIQAKTSNTASVFVGDSALQPFELLPGGSTTISVSNANEVYLRSTIENQAVAWGAV